MFKKLRECERTSRLCRFVFFIAILVLLDKRRSADSSKRLNDGSLSNPYTIAEQCASTDGDAFFDNDSLADNTRLERARLADLNVLENKRIRDARVGMYLAVGSNGRVFDGGVGCQGRLWADQTRTLDLSRSISGGIREGTDSITTSAHLANFTPSLAMYTPARRSSYSTFDKIPASGTSGKTQRRRTSRLYEARIIVSWVNAQL